MPLAFFEQDYAVVGTHKGKHVYENFSFLNKDTKNRARIIFDEAPGGITLLSAGKKSGFKILMPPAIRSTAVRRGLYKELGQLPARIRTRVDFVKNRNCDQKTKSGHKFWIKSEFWVKI